MIELIHLLLKNSGAEQMTLTVKPNGESVTVIAHTQMGALPANATSEVMTARNALQVPVVASGFVGAVDAEFGNLIMSYAESFEPASKAVASNMEAVKQSHKKAASVKVDAKSGSNLPKDKTQTAPVASQKSSSPAPTAAAPVAPIPVAAPEPVSSGDVDEEDDLFTDSL